MSTTAEELLGRLPEAGRRLLELTGRLAAERGEAAYLVGGTVRDLLLELPQVDLDVVVEGDGMAVAQALARRTGGTLTRYHAFQTARVDVPGGQRVDVATARSEVYPQPGHLPRVVAGALEDDLARRDFTINTMALALSPEGSGEIVDPHGGLDDLRDGVIRVLHSRSFTDDPTRVLRAIRFARRFGYRIEEQTERWLGEAVEGGYLERVSGERLRRELAYLLSEAPVEGPLELARRGILAALHPRLDADEARLEALGRLREELQIDSGRADPGQAAAAAPPPRAGAGGSYRPETVSVAERDAERVDAGWPLVLAACAVRLGQQERWRLARHLRLSRAEREPLIGAGNGWQRARDCFRRESAGAGARPSDVERCFRGVAESALLVGLADATAAGDAALCEAVSEYLLHYRHVRPELDGNDVMELGVPAGPAVGEVLEELRASRLDAEVGDREGELRRVRAWLRQKGISGALEGS